MPYVTGWGVRTSGLPGALNALQALKFVFGAAGGDSDTLYICGPTVHYAIYHELGTYKMEARPFMRPAAEQVQANLASDIQAIAGSQGIVLNSEEAIVRSAALAVETRAKAIALRKDIKDTGALINSISAERVR